MSAPRRRPFLVPRGLTIFEAAEYIGHSRTWLNPTRLEDLYRQGFPILDPLTGRIDRYALDAWLDRRSGIGRPPNNPMERESAEQLWIDAANGAP
jgi:hypothetical protein